MTELSNADMPAVLVSTQMEPTVFAIGAMHTHFILKKLACSSIRVPLVHDFGKASGVDDAMDRQPCKDSTAGWERPTNAFDQPICRVTDSSNALIPFQAICTPMQTRKNEDNCVITVMPVAPRICAMRSANP
jgi:hypothetical protein